MTVISVRKMTPTVGKTELATSRVRAMAGIVARDGARAVSYTHLTLPTKA